MNDVERYADLSADGVYRYRLSRRWGGGPDATFVMLNPSTADAYIDDPTIRRCIGFARSWGCGGLVVVNLYALRATNPKALRTHPEPIGSGNYDALCAALQYAQGARSPIVAAWGSNAEQAVVDSFLEHVSTHRGVALTALRVTKSGAPGHPLYLPATSQPEPWPVAP